MRAIIGLGNPGKKYELTRHNVGFMFIDFLADKLNLFNIKKENTYHYFEGSIDNANFILAKPQTFVNLSGLAVIDIIDKYNLNIDDILIVYDDLNLTEGKYKVTLTGKDGGHNGVKSIIEKLNSQDFTRFRIGIGNNFNKGEMIDFVLSKFSKIELENLKLVFQDGVLLSTAFIKNGSNELLNAFSQIKMKSN
ncbi:MAG: aminoacyl-tRNA hydrolase [Ignavibacterium sp.]